MQLNLSELEFTYPGASAPILAGITVSFPQGWTGIVGDNGCGKTTLARIACRELEADVGVVAPDLLAYYCAQDATEPPRLLEDFAYVYDARSLRIRRELGIEDDWPWRYETLSGGQRKMVQIACALWSAPDVLVLDEPTNHVDASARAAIGRVLGGFSGIGILISHDRELLDALCSQCLFMGTGGAVLRPGGYSDATAQAELEGQTLLRQRDRAKREQKRIAREAQRRREEASRTASRRSGRNIATGDNDARFRLRQAIVSGKDGVAGRLSARMEARLERANAEVEGIRLEKHYDAEVWVDSRPSRRPVVLEFPQQSLTLGESKALRTPSLHVGHCDHVALVGDNGCGKTTLVKALVHSLAERGRCLYIPQEPDAATKRAAIERLTGLNNEQRGRVLSIVARLNSRPERMLEGEKISPGEMRKLMLALGVLDRPELIVMDEPTNHLDIGSIRALEGLLRGYPGALLLVSHDAALLAATTSITWRIKPETEGTLRLVVEGA